MDREDLIDDYNEKTGRFSYPGCDDTLEKGEDCQKCKESYQSDSKNEINSDKIKTVRYDEESNSFTHLNCLINQIPAEEKE